MYFEEAVARGGEPGPICNLMISDFAKLLNDAGLVISESKVRPEALVELTELVKEGAISGKTCKTVLAECFRSGGSPSELVRSMGATQISDPEAIREAILQVLAEHPDVVAKYKSGQANVKGFLVGQVMKKSSGRANPGKVQELVSETLEKP
jgi:aspartyl-tRNA(Asn)/glutamyl-tRNA(Gln) amidotransferase subunit B